MTTAEGTVAEGYGPVRAAFAEAQSRDEGGAQLCVYRHGRKVVDLWAGRDREAGRPYTDQTLTVLMSCTKGAVAVCVHMLLERGLLDLEAPVARYWPEFAQAGKDNVNLRHLLTHSAGLLGYDAECGIGAHEMLDWEKATGALARMRPLWEPGTAYFYHFVTFGFLLGEVVRRVTGRSIGSFIAEEIAKPLGIDFWIGLPTREEHRVARHFSTLPAIGDAQWRALLAGVGVDVESRLVKTLLHTFATTNALISEDMNTQAGHAAEIPAGNGIGNARALAKLYASLIGEVDGVRLIAHDTMERARAPQTRGLAPPGDLGKISRAEPQWFGLGFELPRASEPMFGPGSFGHAGAGGRMGFAHPETGLAVGYVCNAMSWNNLEPDARWLPWTKALHDVVGTR